jgi:hypothetical protein
VQQVKQAQLVLLELLVKSDSLVLQDKRDLLVRLVQLVLVQLERLEPLAILE